MKSTHTLTWSTNAQKWSFQFSHKINSTKLQLSSQLYVKIKRTTKNKHTPDISLVFQALKHTENQTIYYHNPTKRKSIASARKNNWLQIIVQPFSGMQQIVCAGWQILKFTHTLFIQKHHQKNAQKLSFTCRFSVYKFGLERPLPINVLLQLKRWERSSTLK